MVSLMGGTTTEQDINACLDSEQKARDQIVKDRATYSSAELSGDGLCPPAQPVAHDYGRDRPRLRLSGEFAERARVCFIGPGRRARTLRHSHLHGDCGRTGHAWRSCWNGAKIRANPRGRIGTI